MSALPYFDIILNRLENETVKQAFGRNVHWGYWPKPTNKIPTLKEFVDASDRLTDLFIDRSDLKPGTKLLDVGCGFGGTIGYLNQKFYGLEMTGINIDSRQIQRARETVESLSKSENRIQFITGDACELPFQENFFDILYAVECIFHFPSRGKFLKEARRVLKPGGSLIISDFVIASPLPAAFLYFKHRLELEGFYGKNQFPILLWRYKLKARLAGLEVSEVLDITQNTLPTYSFFHSIAEEMGAENKDMIISANRYLQTVGKKDWVRYELISFKKPL